jgi:NAD(P)H-nitrite reductase large subunit
LARFLLIHLTAQERGRDMKQSDTVICRCEEVSLNQLIETFERYQCSSREVKLRTRAGMGYCGGRTCRFLIDSIVGQLSGGPPQDEVQLKYQPPVRPVSFGQLGGE